jgi:hypothetical protein
MLVAPSCATLKLSPATVMVPVRGAMLLFGVTSYATRPSPEGPAPEVSSIHETFVPADHAQGVCVRTVIPPVPPRAWYDAEVGSIA